MAAAPLELVRTRLQASRAGEGSSGGVRAGLASVLREAAPGSSLLSRVAPLWRGTGATLARDVPFSALYWTLMTPLRAQLLAAEGGWEGEERALLLRANVLAGGAAGALAALLTTPLDVVKTRLQLRAAGAHEHAPSVRQLLWTAIRERGLLVGAAPRAMRAAPACALTLASYEMLKTGAGTGKNGQPALQ